MHVSKTEITKWTSRSELSHTVTQNYFEKEEISFYEYDHLQCEGIFHEEGGGGDGVLNKTLYGEALNNIPFLTENVPFSYTIYWKIVSLSFHVPSLELWFPF